MTIRRWTKIFHLGDKYTEGIFDGPVQITEKLDGSQINFGIHPDEGLIILSKGARVFPDTADKLFKPAAQHIAQLAAEGALDVGWTYHGETLARPGHNTLVYERVPKNHIALYGVTRPDGSQISAYKDIFDIAHGLNVETVRLIYEGEVATTNVLEELNGWLSIQSQLGKEQIEGVVIKNYAKEQWIGGQLLPLMQAKYVSERFKERHKVAWKENNKQPLTLIAESVKTEARWNKAIQHLKEAGQWEGSPRDIGGLIKQLHKDIEEEDKEEIKDMLWKAFSHDIKRAAVAGFPEAYKRWLVTQEGSIRVD